MKLAEALALRSDVRKRLDQLRERLKLSALVQEGEEPPEDPRRLLEEMDRLLAEFTGLVRRINRTNLATPLDSGRSLTDALAERDTMTLEYSLLQSAVEAASPKMNRLTRSEIRTVPTVNVSDLRARMDALARRRRELDTSIQAANWSTELMD